uniref:Phosphatidylinositol-3,4,5-trisphosphate 3-phosphatase n=1 Tax=Oncorhynchus mykiss TaxID=8022 RepID=A0A8L0DVF0_ONCMY
VEASMLKNIYKLSTDQRGDMYKLSTDQRGDMYKLSTDQRGDMYKLSTDQRGDMYKLSTDQRGDMYKLSTDQRGDMYKLSTDQRGDMYKLSTDQRGDMYKLSTDQRGEMYKLSTDQRGDMYKLSTDQRGDMYKLSTDQRGDMYKLSTDQRGDMYKLNGFDLDLTYVTDRVIAMSFPSSGKQALYRNPIREVARFLDTKHEDHYRVYNLCSEKGYDPKFFHYRVERVFIDDHNVPSLEDMLKYTAGVREWMAADPKNIIAIHCKGGKGRTGTLVCTWLIDSDQFESAQDSLDYFGERRTDKSRSSKFQGVETPSQSRYVGYYEVMKTKFNRQLPPEQSLKIKSIRIHSIAGLIEYPSTIITSTIITSTIITSTP